MEKYHKIQTVWNRDPENKYKTLIEGAWAKPEFAYLSGCPWEATEKVDGTNIRVHWMGIEDKPVWFGGRTDRAQIPTFLYSKLQERFTPGLFWDKFGSLEMALYGEGYGAKIQKGGGLYNPDGVDFILFDVLINGNWQSRDNVQEIARALRIDHVPVVERDNLWNIIEIARSGDYTSRVSQQERLVEGFVMRPVVELRDRLGKRIITKIKLKDFPA